MTDATPTSAAARRRAMLIDQGMRAAAADHRLGLVDRAEQQRHDAAIVADIAAAAEHRRIDRDRALQAEQDRRARYDADAQRRLDAALVSAKRPTPPPSGYAPPTAYATSAAVAAHTRLSVRAHMGVTRADDVRDEHQPAGNSANAARRRLHNMAAR
nr:hypothetical protein [uncultured Lichenicoccus sp.]